MSNVAVNNGDKSNITKNMMKAVGIGATVGAGIQGACAYFGQRAMLQKPDEFIRMIEGEVATKRTFNTPFYKGTQEAADLANKQLDDYLKKATDFIKSGKHDFKAIAKKAGRGALRAGATWGLCYGAFKLIQRAIKGSAKIVAEGVAEAKANHS